MGARKDYILFFISFTALFVPDNDVLTNRMSHLVLE